MNSFLLTIAGFLILVLSAAFAVPHLIDWASYRYVFEAQATKLVGRTVGVGGDVRLSLLPTPVLRFEGVEVADEKGSFERPLAKAQSLTIWLSVPPLLSGTLEAREIEIEKPELNLSVDEEGRGNWHDLGGSGVDLPFAPQAVAFEAINIVDASVTLRRGGANDPWSVDGLSGVFSAKSLDGPFKFTGAYGPEKSPMQIRFSTTRVEDNGTVRVKGSVRQKGESNYAIDGTFTGFNDAPRFDGTLTAQLASEGDLLATGKAGAEVPIEIKSAISASLRGARLTNLEATLRREDRPQTINGSVSTTWHDGLRLDASIGTRWFDFDPMLGSKDTGAKGPAAALATLADRVLTQTRRVQSGRLRLAIDQAILAGDIVNDFAVDFSIDREGLELANVSGRLPGDNEIALRGRLEREEGGPAFRGDVTLVGRKLNRLLRWTGWKGESLPATAETGDFSLQAALTASPVELTFEKVQGTALDTAFTGALRYETGQRREFALELDSDRIDVARLFGPSATPKTLLAWAFGDESSDKKDADGKPKPGNDGEGGSWLKETSAEFDLRVGTMVVPNVGDLAVDAKLHMAKGDLKIRRLMVSAATGLVIRAEGALSGLGSRPDGKLTMSVDGPDAKSVASLATLLEIPGDKVGETQLTALSPMRIVMALESKDDDDRSLEARVGGTLGVSNVSLTGRYQGDVTAFDKAKLSLRGTVSNQDGRALISQLFSNMTAQSLARLGTERGILTLAIDGTVETALDTRLSLDAAGLKFVLDGKAQMNDGGLQVGGRTALRADDLAAGLVLVGYDLGPQEVARPIALRAQLAKAGGIYEFTELTGQVGEDPVSGRVRVDLSKSVPHMDAKLNVSNSSLGALLSPTVDWRPKPKKRNTRNRRKRPYWSDRSFAGELLEGLEGKVALQAARLELADAIELQNAELEAVLANGVLDIKKLKGSLFDGVFDATAKLTRRGTNLALVSKVAAKGLRLDRITGIQRETPLADGKMDIEFALAGEGLSPNGLAAGLTGQGEMRLDSGTLSGLSPDVLRQFVESANAPRQGDKKRARRIKAQVVTALRDARFRFQEAKTGFVVRNGTATFEDMVLENDQGTAKVTSYVELTSLKLDSEWVLKTPVDAQTQIEPQITLTFVGPLSEFGQLNPDVDTQSLERYITMRRMEQDVERLEKLEVPKPPDPTTALPEDNTTGLQGGAAPIGGAPLGERPRTNERRREGAVPETANPALDRATAGEPAPNTREPAALRVAPVREQPAARRTGTAPVVPVERAPARQVPAQPTRRPDPAPREAAVPPAPRPSAPRETIVAPTADRVPTQTRQTDRNETPPQPNVAAPAAQPQPVPPETAAVNAEQRAERADEPPPPRQRGRFNVLDLLRDFTD